MSTGDVQQTHSPQKISQQGSDIVLSKIIRIHVLKREEYTKEETGSEGREEETALLDIRKCTHGFDLRQCRGEICHQKSVIAYTYRHSLPSVGELDDASMPKVIDLESR